MRTEVNPGIPRIGVALACRRRSMLQIGTATVAQASDGASGRLINKVDTVVDYMRELNDPPLRGYEGRKVGWEVGPG